MLTKFKNLLYIVTVLGLILSSNSQIIQNHNEITTANAQGAPEGPGSISIESINPNTNVTTSTAVSGIGNGGSTQHAFPETCSGASVLPQTPEALEDFRYQIDSGSITPMNYSQTATGIIQEPECMDSPSRYRPHRYAFNFSVDATSLSNGNHNITVIARDVATNNDVFNYGTFTVNRGSAGSSTPGNIDIQSINPNPANNSTTVSGRAIGGIKNYTCSGANGGPRAVYMDLINPHYKIDNGTFVPFTWTPDSLGETEPQCPNSAAGTEFSYEYAIPLDTSGLSIGDNHTITIRAQDRATNAPIFDSEPFEIRRNSGFECSLNRNNANVDPGGTDSFGISTRPSGGFNSTVNYAISISPSLPNGPSLSTTNISQNSPYSQSTLTVSTSPNTPSQPYTIVFAGSGGGRQDSCYATFVVNPSGRDFSLILSPLSGLVPPTPPNKTNIGTEVRYQVFAQCDGGFPGPITELAATSAFTGAQISLGTNSLSCGGTTILTVSNTSNIPENQLSTPTNLRYESINVTGKGQL